MKILALVKHVPDTETHVNIVDQGKKLDKSQYKYMIDPCSEYAVEETVRTQESQKGESIVMTVGPEGCQESLRKALAMGIDRAIWVQTQQDEDGLGIDSFTLAKAVQQVIDAEKPDIIFAGLNTTDGTSGNLGPMVAELCQIPSIVNVFKITWGPDGKSLVCEREVEGGVVEVYDVKLPCLIAPHQSLNTPRFTSLPNIMKAKKKTIDQKPWAVSDAPRVKVMEYKLPPEKQPGKIFKGEAVEVMVGKVVQLLRTEAKVI